MKIMKRTKKLNLDTVAGVACYLLLLFYETKKIDYDSVKNFQIDFEDGVFTGRYIKKEEGELLKKIIEVTDNISLIMSAFDYLNDKGLLTFKRTITLDYGDSFYDFHLTDKGIDMIEDAKNNPLNNSALAKSFNLNISSRLNFDSFIKANNIVGIGGVASIETKVC